MQARRNNLHERLVIPKSKLNYNYIIDDKKDLLLNSFDLHTLIKEFSEKFREERKII